MYSSNSACSNPVDYGPVIHKVYRVNHGRLEDAVYTHHCSIWSEIHSQDGGSNRKIEGILYISIPGMLESHHLAHINQLNSIDFLLMLGRILLKSNKAYWILNSYLAVILSGLTLTYHDLWMPVLQSCINDEPMYGIFLHTFHREFLLLVGK